jgi:hypothetical protein
MKYQKVNKTKKNKKSLNGGGIFDIFTNKPKEAEQPKENVKENVKIGPKKTFTLNNQSIKCGECGETVFFKLDTSIDRSKTATIASNYLGMEKLNQVVSHPLKMLVCCNCYSCKFIYQSTTWNQIVQKIAENDYIEQPIVENVAVSAAENKV